MIPFTLISLVAEVAPLRREGLECEFVGMDRRRVTFSHVHSVVVE
jgi:hypothetical protein